MQFHGRSIARLCVLLASVSFVAPGSSASSTGQLPATAVPINPQAFYRPEVRLRKLHLVRPDLIPYPIFYEVYC